MSCAKVGQAEEEFIPGLRPNECEVGWDWEL